MDILEQLERVIGNQEPAQNILEAKVRTIKVCFDPVADEYLNFGVIVNGNGGYDFKVLEIMTRINCLLRGRMDEGDVLDVKEQIEKAIIRCKGDIHSGSLGPNVQICEPRFISGQSLKAMTEQAYQVSVPLGREGLRAGKRDFHFKSTPRLKLDILDVLEQDLEVFRAKKVIHREPFEVMAEIDGQQRNVTINLPLVSSHSVGDIVSAHFANKDRVAAEMLAPTFDLRFARRVLGANTASVSLLRPGENAGLKSSDFRKVNAVIDENIHRMRREGIDLLQADNVEELAHITAMHWREKAA